MYKIRRVNITDVFLLCRCYGSQRNPPNHYETLSVQNDSTQKEIREAFLKLSKEFHPDIGGKESQAKFVKVNEAYNVLSKDHTRKQHDMDLKYQSASAHYGGAYRHSERAYYHETVDFQSRPYNQKPEYDKNYYGIKGIKRVSNGTIAAICIAVCVLIVSIELLALRRSVLKSQMYLKSRSLQAEQHYAEVKAVATSMTREEQIEALQKRFDAQRAVLEGNNR